MRDNGTVALYDLSVEQVAAWLSIIQLDKVLRTEFSDQRIDGGILADGTSIKSLYIRYDFFRLRLLFFKSMPVLVLIAANVELKLSDANDSTTVVIVIDSNKCETNF